MKRLYITALAALILVSGQALAGSGNVNFLLGGKTLTSDWAPPYDEQGELGILFDIRGDYWPVSIAVDLLFSAHSESYVRYYSNAWGYGDETIDATASTSELDVGVRKVFDLPGIDLHPYVGGGLGIMVAGVETDIDGYFYDTSVGYGYYYTDTYSESDASIGYWLNTGIYWSIGGHFNLGVDARYSHADVTLEGREVGAGGSHFGVVAGYRW